MFIQKREGKRGARSHRTLRQAQDELARKPNILLLFSSSYGLQRPARRSPPWNSLVRVEKEGPGVVEKRLHIREKGHFTTAATISLTLNV